MSNTSSRIAEAHERAEQLERQRRLHENREKEQKRRIDTRRKIIVGGICAKSFSWISELIPKRNEASNNVEFAELDCFFSLLAEDTEYVEKLRKKAYEKVSTNASMEP